jgi:Tfp pilus assembly protein PilF
MRTRPLAVALLLALAPVAFAPTVVAQSAADDPTTAMARARFKEGVDFFDKGSFEQARASFLQAYALKKHPAVLLNLAWSCLKSGHAFEAEHYFRQFLNESKDISDKQRADANDGLNQSHTKLGRIEVMAAAGTDVSLDGDHVGTMPLADAIYVDPGAHTVKFKAADGTTDTTSVTVLAGEKAIARLAKAVTPPPPPVPSAPEVTPPPPPPPPKQEEEEPKPEEHAEAKPPPPPEPERTHGHPGIFAPPSNLAPVVVGVTLAIAGGVVAGVMAHSKQAAQSKALGLEQNIKNAGGVSCVPPTPATLGNLPEACASYISDNNDVNTDATIGNIALGVGVGALALTVIYYLAADKGGDSASSGQSPGVFKDARLTPEVGRSTGGLSFSAQF